VATSGDQIFFFVHLMRTGGMTFLHHLRQNFAADEVYPDRDRDFPDGDLLEHLQLSHLLALPPERRERIRVYAGHLPYVSIEMLEVHPVTFTLLRDPVERTISLLRLLQQRRLRERTLEEIYDDPELFARVIHNHQTKMFSMTVEDEPESFRDIVAVDDARLALALANLERVDVVGLSERFDDFLDETHDRFDWQFQKTVRTNAAGNVAEVSTALRLRIAADNAYDLAFYETARDLVERRSDQRARRQ
jgi:hypothetical protein